MARIYFDAQFFKFLKDLKANNNRDWFNQNRPEFISKVRDPLLTFIGDFGAPLRKMFPELVADPRPNGGSMFRIYRDTRFSKDKTPYKTHAAAHFRHARGKDVHAPGVYLHLEPKKVFLGAGIWRPDSGGVAKIRSRIAEHPKAWKKATSGKKFCEHFELHGESLKRPPKGFDREHPLIEDLKRKDFICLAHFTEKETKQPDFMKIFVARCKLSTPVMSFLLEALDL